MGFWGSSREDFVNRRRSPSRDHLLLVSARGGDGRQARLQKVGAVGLLLAALAVGLWATAAGSSALAAWLFQQNSRFAIRHLDLHSSGRLTAAHLKHYAGLAEGQNLFAVSLGNVRARLESVPMVSRAEVQRRLPDTLVVKVQERIPLARIGQAGRPALPVDRDGHLLSPPAAASLPTITGVAERGLAPGGVINEAATRDALTLLDLLDSARLSEAVPLASVDVGDPTQLMVTLRNGGRVALGRDQLSRRLNRLAEMIRYGDENEKDIVFADLTVDRNEPATFKPRADVPPTASTRTVPPHG